MIKVTTKNKRGYEFFLNDELLMTTELIFSPVANKFTKITEYIEDCSRIIGKEFDDFFKSYIEDYKASGLNAEIIVEKIPELKRLVDLHLKMINVNFSNYDSLLNLNWIEFVVNIFYQIVINIYYN